MSALQRDWGCFSGAQVLWIPPGAPQKPSPLFSAKNSLVEQGYYPCYSKDVAKVTSKLQLTVPKAIADEYGIKPGDELQWVAAGEAIRVIPPRGKKLAEQVRTVEERLELFDQATQRQKQRKKKAGNRLPRAAARGWKREDLYDRGLPD